MENSNQMWVVYVVGQWYEPSTTIIGIVSDLDVFKKYAKDTHGVDNYISDYYGSGSLHCEYSVKLHERFSEYYHVVAEPTKLLS